jgi:hypothetical protein
MINHTSIPDGNSELTPETIASITALDNELDCARQQYCEHSGKPLSKVDAKTVENLVTIHGRRVAIEILKTQQRQVSLEWIWLNDTGLAKLALHEPVEYFVYATSKLLQDCTLHSELMRLHEGAEAWRKLQEIDKDILHPINELIRRLLAGYNRKSIQTKLSKFKLKKVNLIADSLENIYQYQLELTDLIKELIAQKKRDKAIQQGMSNFRLQGMITCLSELELSVGRELNDFDLIDGKSADAVDAIIGRQYGNKHNKEKAKQKYATKPVVKVGGFKLNLGGSK